MSPIDVAYQILGEARSRAEQPEWAQGQPAAYWWGIALEAAEYLDLAETCPACGGRRALGAPHPEGCG